METLLLSLVLRVSSAAGFLDMQNQSMEWLVSKGLCAPAAVPSVSGALIPQVTRTFVLASLDCDLVASCWLTPFVPQ